MYLKVSPFYLIIHRKIRFLLRYLTLAKHLKNVVGSYFQGEKIKDLIFYFQIFSILLSYDGVFSLVLSLQLISQYFSIIHKSDSVKNMYIYYLLFNK